MSQGLVSVIMGTYDPDCREIKKISRIYHRPDL